MLTLDSVRTVLDTEGGRVVTVGAVSLTLERGETLARGRVGLRQDHTRQVAAAVAPRKATGAG